MPPDRLAVVGTGLIGASVGLAAKRVGVPEVVGWDADDASLRVAAERGAVDSAAGSLAEAVEGADLVLVATPVASLQETVQAVLEEHLDARYVSLCDPRLNARQSLDLAFRLAELMRELPAQDA